MRVASAVKNDVPLLPSAGRAVRPAVRSQAGGLGPAAWEAYLQEALVDNPARCANPLITLSLLCNASRVIHQPVYNLRYAY